jgi:F-type H+-transporting ATPase subunit delta
MARHSEAVAKSYAKALFDIARARSQIDAVGQELATIAELVTAQARLLAFLSRPWVSPNVKRNATAELASKLGLSPLLRDFLGLVATRNRADHLVAISSAYRALDDEAKNRVRVRLKTAIALTDTERATLNAKLTRVLGGKQVVMEEVVDATMLGGFVAEVGSMILDGSLDTQLDRMRDQLARA